MKKKKTINFIPAIPVIKVSNHVLIFLFAGGDGRLFFMVAAGQLQCIMVIKCS